MPRRANLVWHLSVFRIGLPWVQTAAFERYPLASAVFTCLLVEVDFAQAALSSRRPVSACLTNIRVNLSFRAAQEEKGALLEQVEQIRTHSQEIKYDIRERISLTKRYIGTTELDRELLLQLIDKIVVGQKVEVDGQEWQEIIIYYNLIGKVD